MSDEGERLARLETGFENLEKIISHNHQEILASLKDSTDQARKQHKEHYDKADLHSEAIVTLKTTVTVLKWVIGVGLSLVTGGMSFLKFVKAAP